MKTCFLLALCLLTLNQTALSQTADALVAAGRAHLVLQNITKANTSFAAAVAAAPDHEVANVYYAATRLLSWPVQPASQSFLDRFDISRAGRDIYHWRTEAPLDTNNVPLAPEGMSAYEAIELLRTNALPEITGAAANLAKVTHSNFLLTVASNETGMAEVTLDYGDVLLLRSMLHAAEYVGYTLHSWNLDAQLTAVRSLALSKTTTVQGVLSQYPQLFTFATIADMNAARTAFGNAVDRYLEASAYIRGRSATVTRLFNYDTNMAEAESHFRQVLTDLKGSLAGPVVLTANTNLTVHLARHFAGTDSLRAFLPRFASNAVVLGTVPDPSFGGLVQGLNSAEIERFMSGKLEMFPSFTLPSHLPDGRWQILVNGMDEQTYVIDVSQDLEHWTNVARALSSDGKLTFTDPDAGVPGKRFYRAKGLVNPK